MKHRVLIGLLGIACCAVSETLTAADGAGADASPSTVVSGPFKPDWESLKQYTFPEWFRDAKFGIWAHWGPQCVPEQGDWYGRHMYEPSHEHYQYHAKTYGHPSTFGFKDICHAWKAEKWDPEKMMDLYQRAGAKYFVAMANHHDNFDNWNSKYQSWNSVNIGPKKDIVGIWARIARAHGMRFGVTVHAARAWSWYDVAHGSDAEGPRKGVSYDGVLSRADGKGLWWAGYDPAELYGPHGAARTEAAFQAYGRKFENRVIDLMDSYKPDLLYFDDGDLPGGKAGLAMAARYYNANRMWHGGKLEAVLNIKNPPENCRRAVLLDVEGGSMDNLQTLPWQDDTCIGNWHYDRRAKYRSVSDVLQTLVDVVSKNGNMLLNIPVRGDGSLDDHEIRFLEDMAAWMLVNGKAIFASRPWLTYGENDPNPADDAPRGAADIRFTFKDGKLYAFAMGWPEDNRLIIRSLATTDNLQLGTITDVRLLGCAEKVAWSRTNQGLVVTMPDRKPCEHVYVVEITGSELKPAMVDPYILPDQTGRFQLRGTRIRNHGDFQRFDCWKEVAYWENPKCYASWDVKIDKPGDYQLAITYSCEPSCKGRECSIEVAGRAIAFVPDATGSWWSFQSKPVGKVTFDKAGIYSVAVKSKEPRPMGLKRITITPERR